MQEQEWLASVLPSQQQLDDVLGNDPAAALLGLARSRAPVETGFIGDPGDDPELKKQFAIAQAAAAALKKNSGATLTAEQIQAKERERADRFKGDQLLPIMGLAGGSPSPP